MDNHGDHQLLGEAPSHGLQPSASVPIMAPAEEFTGVDTYQLEPHNYSIEQIRYLERMRKASARQNQVYKRNILKQSFQSEKEKYAKHLEGELFSALGVKKG